MKKKKSLITLIVIMMALVLASAAWIIHKGRADSAARRAAEEAEANQKAEQTEAELGKAEEEAIAEEEAEAAAIASHVISYRGSEGPGEHSFDAYDEAIKAGSRCISVDIVISSDKVLYVSSDDNALAMTGYNGMYEYISSETIDGLTTEAGNKVLRLSEVFDKYGSSINYVVEIKPDSDACVEAFESLVDEYGIADVITAASRFPDVLKTVDDRFPDMPTMLICWNQGDFDRNVDSRYIDMISVRGDTETAIFTESNCESAHAFSKKFGAWTLDTGEDIKKAIDMGADNYFTNETALALEIERDYGSEVRSSGTDQ